MARRQVRYAATRRLLGDLAGRVERFVSPEGTGPFPRSEVVSVVAALRAAGLPTWVGGGWGIDALLGGQTRFHNDLDLVLEDIEVDLPVLAKTLAPLGYSVTREYEGGGWWHRRAVALRNERGLVIECLSANWPLFLAAAELAGAPRGADAKDKLQKAFFTMGTLGGASIPCLSPSAQSIIQTGHQTRPIDVWDARLLARLGSAPLTLREPVYDAPGPHPALTYSVVVPVFAFSGTAFQIWNELNPPLRVPHVTILHPFPGNEGIDSLTLSRLASVFAETGAFDYTLSGVGSFGARVVYARLEPVEPFVDMVRATCAAEHGALPYNGKFSTIIPHVTLVEDRGRNEQRHAAAIRKYLPIQARAEEAWLVYGDPWQIVARFPLGS